MNKTGIEMQRVKSVSICYFFLFISVLYSQKKLEGKYSKLYQFQEHFESLDFDELGSFSYAKGSSGNDFFGNGTYTISKDKLILNYNKTKSIELAYYIPKIWKNSKDSIVVKLQVMNLEKQAVSYANVVYNNNNKPNGFSGVISTNTGEANIVLPKSKQLIELKITAMGFVPFSITINQNVNYVVKVFLQKQGKGIPIRNQVDTLNIVEFNKDFFKVKDKDEHLIMWKKINEN